MQMRDDLGITTKLENGKAYLEFALPEKIGRLLSALQIEIWEGAEGERLVFHGEYSLEEADSMTALLLRPHLWDGMRDPYVYLVKAQGRFGTVEYGEKMGGMEKEEESDPAEDIPEAVEVYWRQKLAIYDVRVVDKKGIFLNEKEFLPHEVAYRLPPQISDVGTWEEQMKADLEQLARMGVNGDPVGRNRIRDRGTGSLRSAVVLQSVQRTWIPYGGPVDKTGKSPSVPWITRRNDMPSTPGGGRQDTDRAILLLSGKMEQRTGALSGTFYPASSGERAGLPDQFTAIRKKWCSMWRGYFSYFSRPHPVIRNSFLKIFLWRSCRCIWRRRQEI